jgi:PAS domain-containing protein
MPALSKTAPAFPAPTFQGVDTFDLTPVSLWLEDFSGVKVQFETWRRAGVTSLREYLEEDLGRVKTCAGLIRVVKVNAKTLSLFEAEDLVRLTANLDRVFRDDMLASHLEELVQLWDGLTQFSSNAVNYTLSGRRLDIQLEGRILPGYESDWARVLVAIDDVSEREAARRSLAASEAYARGLFDHSPVSLWVEDFSGIKKLIDEVRNQQTHASVVRRQRQVDFIAAALRDLPRRDAVPLPRAVDRSVARQAVPAARGRELFADGRRAASAFAVHRVARPRTRLVSCSDRADGHHRS